MNKEEKAAAVAELTEELKGAGAIFAVDYRGISVTEAAELRTRLREADAVFKVVKNRLAKRAAADAGTDQIEELLTGPTALTLIKGDAVVAAKAISTFAKEHEVLVFKGGFMDGEELDPDAFQAIARLPGVDVLRGQLVGLAASPLTGLAAGLNNLISGLGRQLAQMAEQGLVSGEAPAEEAPTPEETSEGPTAEETSEEPAAEETSEEPAAEAEAEAEETSNEEQSEGDEESPAAETDNDTEDESPGEVEAEAETSEGDEEE